MGEVVRFAGREGEQIEAEARARSVARFDALERVLKAKPLMGRQDQVAVAEGLWKLLKRAEQQNVRKAQVLIAAGIGGEHDSTKHLSQYAVNPSWPRERKEKARLNKRPHKYREITEAAARLAGWEPRDAVLEVFSGTTLTSSQPGREAAPEYEELARTLREIVDSVAVKHDLQRYFQAVARSKPRLLVLNDDEDAPRNRLEPDEILLYFDDQSNVLDWPIRLNDPSEDRDLHDFMSSVPPYPALVLGEWDIGDKFRIRVESDQCSRDGVPLLPAPGAIISGQYSVELRLCIVPEGPDMRPVGALRVASLFRLGPIDEKDDEFGRVAKINSLVSSPGKEWEDFWGITARDGSGCFGRLRCDSGTAPDLITEYGLDRLRGCHFSPLNGPVCQDWLQIDLENGGWYPTDKPVHVRVLGPSILDSQYCTGLSPFPTGTVASGIDRCLSGVGAWDLLDLLDERAGNLVELLADAQELSKHARAAGYKKLAAHLRAMRKDREDG